MSLPAVFSGVRVTIFSFMCMFCRSLIAFCPLFGHCVVCSSSFCPILFQYCYKYCYSVPEPLSRNESGRFSALKSDSTHHFFRNGCTKSGSLRFSQFSGC